MKIAPSDETLSAATSPPTLTDSDRLAWRDCHRHRHWRHHRRRRILKQKVRIAYCHSREATDSSARYD